MKTWTTKSGYTLTRIIGGRSNVFLLTAGNKNVLIDTSVSLTWGMLQNRLSNLGVSTIDYLIVTHAHFDHAANAHRIKAKFNSAVIVQKLEAEYLAAGDNLIPDGTNPVARLLMNQVGRRIFHKFRYEPCEYDIIVEDYLDLKQVCLNAFLMHTPGHTPGSMSLIVDEEIAVVGDTMFGVFPRSVFPPFAVDPEEMIRSWGKLLETPCSLFLPSHGGGNRRDLVEKDYNKRKNQHYKL